MLHYADLKIFLFKIFFKEALLFSNAIQAKESIADNGDNIINKN